MGFFLPSGYKSEDKPARPLEMSEHMDEEMMQLVYGLA